MHNAVRNASNKYSKHRQNENEANDITWSQIFDAKQQCWKNVTQLTRWPCSIMNSKYRVKLQKNVCNGQRFASFYCCLAFARFWKVKFWRSFIKCKYFNDGWTDFHKNIYLYLGLFSKTGKTLVSHRVKTVTRTWKMTRWPNDPVPCLVHTTSRHREKETEKRSTDDDIMPRTQQPGDKHWWWLKIISRKTGGAETWSFISSQYFKVGLTQSPGGGRGDGMRWRTILINTEVERLL